MPKIFSKYKNSEQALSFDKRVTRESSCIGGETGIDPKREQFLQDYDANHEVNKRPLSRGRKYILLLNIGVDIKFEQKPKREEPGHDSKRQYRNAVYHFNHLFELQETKKVLGHHQKRDIVPWDTQLPRDNIVYCVSETQNLKHIDQEIREEFRKTLASHKLSR